MDLFTIIATLVTLALGVSVVWSRVEKVIAAMKEVAETLSLISQALEDQKLSAEELAAIKQEIKEDIAAIKAIFK